MKHLLKTTFHNFERKPVINLINLLGLAISLALVIVLSLYCYSELTTDKYHANVNRVYLFSDQNNLPKIYTPAILKEHIDINIPEVESTVRIGSTWEAPVFRAEGREPITSDLLFADPDFFKLFTYHVSEGDLNTALNNPLSIVITKELSKRLFGNEPALDKSIKLNNNQVLTVKAVIDAPEGNSCISFSALTSIESRKIIMPIEPEFKVWDMCTFQTFVLLKDNVEPRAIASKIWSFFPKEMQRNPSDAQLTPLKNIYFSQFSLFNGNYLRTGDFNKIIILLVVAGLVLLIALVNFLNISSSQWIEKIKQTGVMKVVGGSRSTILMNILVNAFVFFLIALFIAVFMVSILAPAVLNYTGIHFNQNILYSPMFFVIAITVTLVVSVLFTLVPAWKIATSKVTDNLKNSVEPYRSGSVIRGVLVVTQFTIAMVLIAFTVLIQKQVYFGSANLGMNQENIIGIKLTPELQPQKEVLKKLLSENPNVVKTTFTQYFPGQLTSHWSTQTDENGEKKPLEYDSFFADGSFFETMGLQLVNGRFYSGDIADADKVVVNETFIHQNRLHNSVGTKFSGMGGKVYEIVGVVKDFHYKPITQPIGALAILNESFASYCLVNLRTSNYGVLHSSIKDIKTSVTRLSPSFPVEVSFMDQAVEHLYQSELQFRRAFSLFSGCAIVICCLGILAMSILACQNRTKEIGIRKVNGSKTWQIMAMLNMDLIKWVAIAFLIACPLAWYVMHKWLENFAYKTALSWWIFAAAGVIALVIALLTVSLQSYRAATRNPVESLRYE